MTYLLSGELSPSDSFFHLSHARMKRVARKHFSSGFLLPYLSPTAIVTNPFPPFPDEPIVGPNALQDPIYAIVVKDYIYAGPFRLVQEMFPASITLESVATVGGRIVKNGNNLQPRYFITDHLGSTRVVLDNFGDVLERTIIILMARLFPFPLHLREILTTFIPGRNPRTRSLA